MERKANSSLIGMEKPDEDDIEVIRKYQKNKKEGKLKLIEI